MFEYNMVVYNQPMAAIANEEFTERADNLRILLSDFAVHLQEFVNELPRGDWEPVSHSVAAIGDILVTSVLVRRQLP